MKIFLLGGLWLGISLFLYGQDLTSYPLLSESSPYLTGVDVQSVTQDEEGFIWIATSDHCWRFDGKELVSLTELVGLHGGATAMQYANASLWLVRNGLLTEIPLGTYSLVEHTSLLHNTLDQPLSEVNALEGDSLGRLWVSYSNGLAVRDSQGAWINGEAWLPAPGSFVVGTSFDRDSALWVLTQTHISRVIFHSLQDLRVESILHIALPEEVSAGDSKLLGLCPSPQAPDAMYYATTEALFHLKFEEAKRHYLHERILYEPTSALSPRFQFLLADTLHTQVWVGSDQGLWHTTSDTLQHVSPRGWPRHIAHMTPVRWEGRPTLLMVADGQLHHVAPTEGSIVSSFDPGETTLTGQCWRVFQENGRALPVYQSAPFHVPVLDTSPHLVIHQLTYRGSPLSVDYLRLGGIVDGIGIYCSSQGLLWIDGGESVGDDSEIKVVKWLDGAALPADAPHVAAMGTLDTHSLWVGFQKTGREVLIRLNTHHGTYSPLMTFDNSDIRLTGGICDLWVGSHPEGEQIWIRTKAGQLLHTLYRPGARRLHLIDQVTHVREDGQQIEIFPLDVPHPMPDQDQWLLPSAEGLWLYNAAQRHATRIDPQSSHTLTHHARLYQDQQGDYWWWQGHTWFRIEYRQGRWQALPSSFYPANSFPSIGLIDAPTQTQVITKTALLCVPDSLADFSAPPSPTPVLTQAEGTVIHDHLSSAIHQGLTYADTLHISSSEHTIAIDIALPGSSQRHYWYQLLGYDLVPIRSTAREIRYAHLPPGQYQLLVSGKPIEQPVDPAIRSLHIDIASAWWQPLWPYALYGVSGMVVLALFFRWRDRVSSRGGLVSLESSHAYTRGRPAKPSPEDERFLAQMNDVLAQQIEDPQLTVGKLASEMHLSHSQFTRKVKFLTEQRPVQLIKEMRLARAAELLQMGTYQIAEVAYLCGFSDPDYFRRCFKQAYAQSPSAYQRRMVGF